MSKVHVSIMTGKLEGMHAINSNPLTNNFCQGMRKSKKSICKDCYSCSMLQTFRKLCQPSFNRNDKAMEFDLLPVEDLPLLNDAIFRFNGHGELRSYIHLVNYMNIALKNPHCKFTLWTKRINFVSQYLKRNPKPSNLFLVYSSPILNKRSKLPDNFDKVFTVYDGDQKGIKINCGGKKCLECRFCYSNNRIRFINERIK